MGSISKNIKRRAFLTLVVFSLTMTIVGCEGRQQQTKDEMIEESSHLDIDEQQKEKNQLEGKSLNIINDKYRTTYEIFVYSFYDSNGDGIGDLKGVTEKLDYINDGDDSTDSDLGCNEIWLMPISPSPTYHKYDITDYKAIDPEYGTLDDFDELLKECHSRGVNVIIDLVLNHTSSEHPWFKDAAANHEASEYFDYYNWSKEPQSGYEQLPGSDYYYEARFWSGMPDLNLDSEAVRDEIKDITKFWIDRGVDGFRLDAVTSYYTSEDTKNIEFLTWLNDTIKSQKEDAYIVGEAWTSIATYSKYYKSGIDSFFDFNSAGSEGTIAGVARGTLPATQYADTLKSTEEALYANNENAINAPFYTNHDMARSAGYYTGKGSQDKVKLAGALNLLTTGNAFIYYGEELGMKGSGKDENKRAPMYWSASDENGMCDGPKDMDKFDMKYPSLDEQAADEHSIYNYYKAAIKIRNMYPVIARGVTEPVDELSSSNVSAFIRKEKTEGEFETGSLLIIINTSDSAQTVDVAASDLSKEYLNLVYSLKTSEEVPNMEGGSVTIPAYGIVVMAEH